MAYDSDTKSAAELQREIELQRTRVEDTIDQIQQKLSPGQLVDEMLAYTKGGGGEFLSAAGSAIGREHCLAHGQTSEHRLYIIEEVFRP